MSRCKSELYQIQWISNILSLALTVHERGVDDILGLVQEPLPSLLHQLPDLLPGFKVQVQDLDMVEGGPAATADKEEAEEEDAKEDSMWNEDP